MYFLVIKITYVTRTFKRTIISFAYSALHLKKKIFNAFIFYQVHTMTMHIRL
jgi:hypothetical protein